MSVLDRARQLFTADVAKHEMTVLKDDGLYKHLRFQTPGHSFEWFDIVTWPGALSVGGDRDGFVFRCSEDMLAFFRESARTASGINPGYWAEKVKDGRDRCRSYSQELFDKTVAEDLAEAEEGWPGVTAAWAEFCEDYNTEYEQAALAALQHFEYWPADNEPYTFQEWWSWQLKDHDFDFLMACHAIAWGIARYDAAQAAKAA